MRWACDKFSAFFSCPWTLTVSSVQPVPWLNLQARPSGPPVSWTSPPGVSQSPQTQLIKTDLISLLEPTSPPEFSILGSALLPPQSCRNSPSWRPFTSWNRDPWLPPWKGSHSSPFLHHYYLCTPLSALQWLCLSAGFCLTSILGISLCFGQKQNSSHMDQMKDH